MKRLVGTLMFVAIALAVRPLVCIAQSPQAEPAASGTLTTSRGPGRMVPGPSSDKPREVSPESLAKLKKLREGKPFGTNELSLEKLRAIMNRRREPTIENVTLIRTKIDEIPGEWVLAPGADPDLRLLYLHGGGFVSGTGGYYLPLAAHISAAAKCAVLVIDYRLAPEHPFPAGLEDCIRSHEWLVANGPTGPTPARATFIAGDSAGGSLTLSTVIALHDRKKRMPVGAIPISPCTDFRLLNESLKTVDDPIISSRSMPWFRELYLGADYEKLSVDKLASPGLGYGTHELPPTLIQVGEHEMLRDDAVQVYESSIRAGGGVQLEIWPGMVHVFQSREPLLPEAKEAIQHIADFMRKSLDLATKQRRSEEEVRKRKEADELQRRRLDQPKVPQLR